MPTGLAIASLAVTAAGTAMSIREQRKAQDAQEEAQEVQQNQAAVQNRRARQQAVERARRRRAAVTAQSQAQGALRSSPVQGALGAFEADTGANLAFQRQLQDLGQQRSQALGRASQASGRARTFQAIGQVPGQLGFSPAASVKQIGKSFQSNSSGNNLQGPNLIGSPQN